MAEDIPTIGPDLTGPLVRRGHTKRRDRKRAPLKGKVLQKGRENAMEEVLRPHFQCFSLPEEEECQKIAGISKARCVK